MKSPKARWIGLTLLGVLIFVGFGVGDRLRSPAILYRLEPHVGVFHPDRPEFSDPDGRFRLDPHDDTLPSGPDPLTEPELPAWLAEQWPGASIVGTRTVFTSGSRGRIHHRLVEFDVEFRGRTSPAALLCVKHDRDLLFRGVVLIFDRKSIDQTRDSANWSSFRRPKLMTRLLQSVGWEWTLRYAEPGS